jgi:hypothetical protein
MGWQTWWRAAVQTTGHASKPDPEPDWPDSHVADHDPRHIQALIDDLMRTRADVRLHLTNGPDAVGATLLRHRDGVLTLQASSTLHGAPALAGRVNVTAALPRELVMFSAEALSCTDGTRLHLRCPDELLHLQSRESFRVRCLRGPGLSAELEVPGLAPAQALQLLDLSEGGAGLLVQQAPCVGSEDGLSGLLRVGREALPLAELRVAHAARGRDGRWRVGLQFLHLEPAVARAMRRGLALLETAAGA